MFAIKVVSTQREKEGDKDGDVRNEIELMTQLDHLNVLKLITFFEANSQAQFQEAVDVGKTDSGEYDQLCLVLEFMKHNQLMETVPGKCNSLEMNKFFIGNGIKGVLEGAGSVPAETLVHIFIQLIEGLQYVHSKRIFHRDLKPQNIMVAEDGTCKIADFGISHQFQEGEPPIVYEFQEGTLLFSPPELEDMIDEQGFDGFIADIWALGITFYCLVFWKPPYEAENWYELSEKWNNTEVDYSSITDIDNHQAILTVLQGFLTKDPSQRMSLKAALEILSAGSRLSNSIGSDLDEIFTINADSVQHLADPGLQPVVCKERVVHVTKKQEMIISSVFTSTESVSSAALLEVVEYLRLPPLRVGIEELDIGQPGRGLITRSPIELEPSISEN